MQRPPPAKGPRLVAPPLGPYAPPADRVGAADRRGRLRLPPRWLLLRCRRRLCLWTLLSPAGAPGT